MKGEQGRVSVHGSCPVGVRGHGHAVAKRADRGLAPLAVRATGGDAHRMAGQTSTLTEASGSLRAGRCRERPGFGS